MSGVLVDTNVVSELTKQNPDTRIISFFVKHVDLWLSTIVLHELKFGVELLPRGAKRDKIYFNLSDFVAQYCDRILPVGEPEVSQAARYRLQAQRMGRILDLGDALIAGTAKVNNLAIATRNIRDFDYLDLEIINPWDEFYPA